MSNSPAYTEANRAKIIAYNRAYYLANKERMNQQSKLNQPKYKVQKRAYAKAHKDELEVYFREYYERNKETILKKSSKQAPEWRKANKDKYRVIKRRAVLKANYGITPEQFDEMASAQGYACAICRLVPTRILHIDHCHQTYKVRGLLCSTCNTGIGLLKENTEFLASAIKYLSI